MEQKNAGFPGGKTTLFYDGACSLCRAEVNVYRTHDPAGELRFCDVSQPAAELPPGLDRNQALRRFHVLSAEGQMLSGAAAFLEVWRHLPGWRIAAGLARLPGIMLFLEVAYRGFLRLRPRLVRLFLALHRRR